MSLPRCPFYSKAIYKFNTTWIKIPGSYLAEMEKSVLKTYEILGPQISKTKQSWTWSSLGLSLPFGTNWNANVIKPWCRWGRTRQLNTDLQIDTRGQQGVNKSVKAVRHDRLSRCARETSSPSARGDAGTFLYYMQKKNKKKFKTDQKLKSLKNLWCVCARICRCTCGYVH